jgi:hypothetical protein
MDMLTYEYIEEKPKEFLAATGMTVEEFDLILPAFRIRYAGLFTPGKTRQGKDRQRKEGGGVKEKLQTDEDKLLFILVYQKTYPIQTMHGLQFDLSQSQTHYWVHRLLPVLRASLADMGQAPEREPQAVADHPLVKEAAPDLLIDGTERRRQRPKDNVKQGEHYSGKKKAHTDKNIVLANSNTRKIAYLSPTEAGSQHDKKIADENAIAYPSGATLGKDTGFQGYEPQGVITFQPKKKPKGKELSKAEKWLNEIISGARVVVENVLAGVKRCRIVKDVFRNTKAGFSDLAMEVACSLHNLRMDCRHPVEPAISLLQLAT